MTELARNTRPFVIFVVGTPGSGKSTLASALAAETKSTYLCSDFIAEELYGDDRASEKYLRLRDSVYDIIFRLARENLTLGNNVLIDAPMARALRYDAFVAKIRGILSLTDANLAVFRCYCSADVLRTRIQARNVPRDSENLANWDAFLVDQPIQFAIPFDHTDVDTEKTVEENVQSCLHVLAVLADSSS